MQYILIIWDNSNAEKKGFTIFEFYYRYNNRCKLCEYATYQLLNNVMGPSLFQFQSFLFLKLFQKYSHFLITCFQCAASHLSPLDASSCSVPNTISLCPCERENMWHTRLYHFSMCLVRLVARGVGGSPVHQLRECFRNESFSRVPSEFQDVIKING